MSRARSKDVLVTRNLLAANDLIAGRIRDTCARSGLFLVNMISAPGSGKTTLLESLVDKMQKEEVAVVVADIDTDRDQKRIQKKGVRALQLNTDGACHLEAGIVEQVIAELLEAKYRFVFIENIGNLICPTEFDLGEHLRIVVLSTTEGDDKVMKYPAAFKDSQVLAINKIDLLPHVSFDAARVREEAKLLNPSLRVLEVSATSGEGIDGLMRTLVASRDRCMS